MTETRYTYTLTERDEEQLQREIAALAVPGFICVCGSGDVVQVVFADAIGQADADRVAAAVAAHVPDPAAPVARTRERALSTLLSRGDETAIAVRATVEAVTFLFNNRLEALGQTRVTQEEIFDHIGANPTLGDPR